MKIYYLCSSSSTKCRSRCLVTVDLNTKLADIYLKDQTHNHPISTNNIITHYFQNSSKNSKKSTESSHEAYTKVPYFLFSVF